MLKERFAALNRKDQQTLLIAAPIVALLIIWLAIVNPQLERHQQLTQELERKQADLAWMQQAAMSLNSQQSNAPNALAAGSLRQEATQAFTRQKISINRIQSNQENELSMWADQVSFDQLLTVLGSLTTRGITLDQIQLNPTTAGRVNVRLTLTTGS
ncbi:type II secretion system protein GspM [Neptunomonas phycophila]|uniref:type II secretion system protein GspM n=1 Tax=Neptunomonas phycophila TaxID=1572645 RepID=UPI0026E35278|nr:type II secretion system protein GspM [Neptunomonas phycophila]MDO6784691.1 type II secretion system protein GspM [Neptunomonas phycophila]